MNIGLLNEKVTFQKNEVVIDDIGNHKNAWNDYFSCFATISGESGSEGTAAGQTVEHTDADFTVRYCKKTAAVTVDDYRILFRDEIYNIVGIDHMNYKKKSLKFRCEKVRR